MRRFRSPVFFLLACLLFAVALDMIGVSQVADIPIATYAWVLGLVGAVAITLRSPA